MTKHLQNWIQKKIYNKNKIINMVHFLRTEKNITIIECEAWQGDLSAATNIDEYSKMLLWIHSEDKSKTQDFINDFSNLDSIRGWWWEKEEMMGKWNFINDFVRDKFKEVAEKWNLVYVTD
jgi:hypothetical protein